MVRGWGGFFAVIQGKGVRARSALTREVYRVGEMAMLLVGVDGIAVLLSCGGGIVIDHLLDLGFEGEHPLCAEQAGFGGEFGSLGDHGGSGGSFVEGEDAVDLVFR